MCPSPDADVTREPTSLAGAPTGSVPETCSTEQAPRASAAEASPALGVATYVEVPPSDEEARAGQVVAGRYTLEEPLGAGAFGEVWTAQDRVLRERVALKWLRRSVGPRQARVRREITTLRLLQVPGVVRLLDEGIEDERPFLVMERIEGAPFPGERGARAPWGPASRWTWAEIAGPALALLEVLARVHAAGIVHRDLKPDNVLVSAEGRPTVLDFGISLWQEQGDRLTQTGQILGTPRYLAPEQIVGQSIDGRTDLYALGVMLYRALCGVTPHDAPDLQSMLRARLTTPARPAAQLAPELPPAIARVIDSMLALRVEDRPRSAAEALAAFRGQPGAGTPGLSLPRLGGDIAVQAALREALGGRSVDVVGAAGTGRSRCLADVAEALSAAGRRVVRVEPSRAPLGSLRPITGTPPEHATLGLAELSAWITDSIQQEIRGGAVLVADDAEQLDRWSVAVLSLCSPGPGAIVRARLAKAGDTVIAPPSAPATPAAPAAPPAPAAPAAPAAPPAVAVPAMGQATSPPCGPLIVPLAPLDEASLRPLFAGPDRLFHLREDGARVLWERTLGLPLRIDAEVTLWLRLGLARREGAEIVVERDALNRLQAGLPGASQGASGSGRLGEPREEQELLGWLSLGGRHLALQDLARVMDQPVWAVEADRDVLVERGLARRLAGGRAEPTGHVDLPWSAARLSEAHRAIAAALRPGDEGRLFHLLLSEDALAAAREAVVLARRHAAERGLGEATAALAEGLRALREDERGAGEGSDEEVEILREWTKVAFAQGTPSALDRVLYELSRSLSGSPAVAHLVALCRAGLAAPGASGLRAMEDADDLPPFEDPQLERRRQRARIVAAAARVNPTLLDCVLDEVSAWAERTGEPMARLCLAEGKALLRYQQGRFEEAAELNAEAARLDPWLTGRIAATLNGASAMLEAFRHEEAEERADAGRRLAAYCRMPYWEARAEWLLRSARYRRGEAHEADHELCAAVAKVGTPDLEALVCLNEAAVAMRAGDLSAGAALADRAARVWREMARTWGASLARSLAIACGSVADPGEVEALSAKAAECKLPGIGIQALALLSRVAPALRESWEEAVPALTRGVPEASWHLRMDVLSMDEALAGAKGKEGVAEGH